MIDRRTMIALLGAGAAAPLLGAAPPPAEAAMWRDPGCECCTAWARKIEAALGLRLRVIDARDMAAVKRAQGVPADLQGCHTAVIRGFVIEGHVPAEDIRRLLTARPRNVRMLAVPGMQPGTPGMEADEHDPYKVIAVEKAGKRWTFSIHA